MTTRMAELAMNFGVGVLCSALAIGCGGENRNASADAADGNANDLSTIDLATNDLATNDLATNDLSTNDLSTDDGNVNASVVTQIAGVVVTTLAGSSTGGTGDGQLLNPTGVTVAANGDLYVTEYDANRVRKVTPDGAMSQVTLQAGFALPFAITLLNDNEAVVQTDADDTGIKHAASGTLWRVSFVDGNATKLIGGLGRPRGLAPIGDGRILVADRTRATISALSPATGQMEQLVGEPPLVAPIGIAVTPSGAYLVADSAAGVIRAIAPTTNAVSTFAGIDGTRGMVDGAKGAARFDRPIALAVAGDGTVYVSDAGLNHRIRRITPAGMVETVAGTGERGFADGEGGDAKFYGQEGIALSPDCSKLYVADGNEGDGSGYHRVRQIALP